MPGISGFDVLSKLKNSPITMNIPVIFLTGLDNVEDEEKGLLLGAVDYIIKPFHKSIVKARIRTHLKMAEYIRTIEKLCMLDPLTGLPNRRGFDSRMNVEWGRAFREKSPLGLIMGDLDNFKIYNDTYGHPQGDALLQAVAEVFMQTLNRQSDFAARWGGEEFVVILPHTDMEGALVISEHLRTVIEELKIPYNDGFLSVTISIGLNCEVPPRYSAPSDFLSKADKALYAAKEAGRNRVMTSVAPLVIE
jgi:diguanylate cyclase (GGDEF)-like protein